MQTDHRVPNTNPALSRQQSHRKRSFSGAHSRKRDRHDLICVVCHAPAMGYNFDQITCESCKAFFRRNALNNVEKFKCRSGSNDCLINLETRKRCKACRLRKCFEKGLRKEWIMSEEEKRTKKQKIEDNRRLRALSQNVTLSSIRSSSPSSSPSIVPENERFNPSMDYSCHLNDDDDGDVYNDDDESEDRHTFDSNSLSTNEELSQKSTTVTSLSTNDRLLLSQIENSYIQAVRLNVSVIKGCSSPCLRDLRDVTDLINELAQMSTVRMITFLKLTPEFRSLSEDDRFALVKQNSMAIFYLHLCLCTNLSTEIYREPETSNDFCYPARALRLFSEEIHRQAMAFIEEIQQLSSMDHTVIKLLILVMSFSTGSDLDESTSLQTEHIFRTQNIYIQLLWNYLDGRFGADQTASIFSGLIFSCMKAHVLGRQTKVTVSRQIQDSQLLAPLMQSVLLIS